MYDYNNARFLSVDPFIQAITSTQSMNPYTYIFNNPLSGVDPTGYQCQSKDDKACGGEKEKEDKKNKLKDKLKGKHGRKGGQGFTSNFQDGSFASSNGMADFTAAGKALKGILSDINKQLDILQKGFDVADKSKKNLPNSNLHCENTPCRSNVYRGIGVQLLQMGNKGGAAWFFVAADTVEGIDAGFDGKSSVLAGIGFSGPSTEAAIVVLRVSSELEAHNFRNADLLLAGKKIPGLEGLKGLNLTNAMGALEQGLAQNFLDAALSGDPNRTEIIGNINEHFNGGIDRFFTGFISINTENALNTQFPNNDFDFSNKLQRTKLAVELFRLKFDEL